MLAVESGTRARKGHRPIIAAFMFLVVALTLVAGTPVRAAGVTWERFDVDLEVRPDGTFRVTERQVIRFEGSGYSSGFATLPLERVEEISDIRVSEERGGDVMPYEPVAWSRYDDEAETFSARKSGAEIEIAWGFPETRNGRRVFLIEYEVSGALRVYEDETGTYEQIWWTAISSDVTGIGDVEQSTVTIRLPEAVDPGDVLIGEDAEERPADHTDDGRTWSWTRQHLTSGDDFTVRLEFPAIVGAAPPSWQQADDERRLDEEQRDDRQALIDVAFIGIGLLSLVLGGTGLYGLWHARGRDPHAGLVADFLPQPPDDLPPGAAGALIDEVAHERDIVATIVDLGRRNVIKIDEDPVGAQAAGSAHDFTLTLLRADPTVTDFERTLLHALFGPTLTEGASEWMSRARSGFSANAERIKEQMYGELVKRGYFSASPEATRDRWRAGAIAALAIVLLVACFGGALLTSISAFAFLPLGIAGVVAFALIFLSRVLPRKTPAGAEAAAKWRAFKRYLADIEHYDRLNEAKQIFDKYLPYAVAFGLEESWVRKFAATGAPAPSWYGPVVISGPQDWTRSPRHRRRTYGGGTWVFPSGGGTRPSQGRDWGDGYDFPDLQEMSDRAGGGLQRTSNSLFDMLTSAAEAFGDFSGGGAGRRHWGGGGGFRGGGGRRSGGSFGGGRRGFR